MTVPPRVNSEMHFLVKIDRQKEFYVHCPHQTHWPRMAESSILLPKVTQERVLEEYGMNSVQE
jgi:hypothetical protein